MPETLNQRWAATLVGSLVALGVRHAVVSPGSRSTPLALALAEHPALRCWPVIDERVAGFFGLGLAQATGGPVVLLCTSGTAGAHWLPALMEASEVGAPLLAVTADRPWELHGFGAPQTVAQAGLFGDFVRARALLPAPEDSAGVFAHLVAEVARVEAQSRGAKPGPVHFNVPFREPLVHPEGTPGPVVPVAPPRFAFPSARVDLSPVVEWLAQAQRPLVVCGPRDTDDDFAAHVHALAAAIGAPVLADATSNARYGQVGAVRHADLLLRHERTAAGLRPDLVLRFGGGLSSKVAQQWLEASGARTVVFRERGPVIDPAHGASLVLQGDAQAACGALARARSQATTYRTRFLEADARAAAALEAACTGLDEPTIARAVAASLRAGTALVVSSSMPVRDLDAFSSRAGGVRVFSNRGLNGIDGVTSTALGVAAGGGQPTVLLVGDVALLHDLSAWVAARQTGVPLTVVVINNDGGGIFSFLPVSGRTAHFERLFGTPHGVDLAAVAQVGGATLHRPTSLAALREVLSATAEGGLHLVEVRTDRAQNVAAHRRLHEAVLGALEAMPWD